jgi:hypothetical protein
VFHVVAEHEAEDRVLLIMKDGFGPALRHAAFVGKSAFMARISQCGPNGKPGNCHPDPAAAIASLDPLKPVAYTVAFHEDAFLERTGRALDASKPRLFVNTLPIANDAVSFLGHYGSAWSRGADSSEPLKAIPLKS